jgi:hypothetical protein
MALSKTVNREPHYLTSGGDDVSIDIILDLDCQSRLNPEYNLQSIEPLIVADQ